jgi:hypothetical protein
VWVLIRKSGKAAASPRLPVTPNNDTREFWEYNATGNRWIQKASFIGDQRYFSVRFYIGSRVYVGLGAKTSNSDIIEFTRITGAEVPGSFGSQPTAKSGF